MQRGLSEDLEGVELLTQIEQMGEERLAECISRIESTLPAAALADLNAATPSGMAGMSCQPAYRKLAPDPIAPDASAALAARVRKPLPTQPIPEPLREQDRLLD